MFGQLQPRIGISRASSYLESQDFRLDQSERLAVDLDQALASLSPERVAVSISFPHSASAEASTQTNLALGDSRSRLLLAEALYELCVHHGCG